MKKKIIPSKCMFMFSILGIISDMIIICGCIGIKYWYIAIGVIEWLHNDPSILNIILGLLTIVLWFLLVPFMTVLVALGSLELYIFAGRPVKFSDDQISIGRIKKKYYDRKNITGIGIAPMLNGRLYKDWKSNSMGIYIAFGGYRKSDFSDYGIVNVCKMVEFRKVCPKAVDIEAKRSQPDLTKIQIFDGLVWIKYTEENMRFLKEWMGSKFDEVTQQ